MGAGTLIKLNGERTNWERTMKINGVKIFTLYNGFLKQKPNCAFSVGVQLGTLVAQTV
jgi:hypothetical protein